MRACWPFAAKPSRRSIIWIEAFHMKLQGNDARGGFLIGFFSLALVPLVRCFVEFNIAALATAPTAETE